MINTIVQKLAFIGIYMSGSSAATKFSVKNTCCLHCVRLWPMENKPFQFLWI